MSKPLIFFVHVPKAAGTTVTAYLSEHDRNGLAHCHALFENDNALRDAAIHLNWMAGHVDLSTAERLETVTDRPVRFFASMQEPAAQVSSHYNWLIEAYYKNALPTERAEHISGCIRHSECNPGTVITNLQSFPDLFLNCQSRYILGRQFQGPFESRLSKYEMIVRVEELASLLACMTGNTESRRIGRKNSSRYHFSKDVFSTPEVRSFLAKRNAQDQALYEHLCARQTTRTQLVGQS